MSVETGIPQSRLEGRLVRLQARELSDLAAQHRWFNDPEVMRYMQVRYPTSRAFQERYLERVSSPGFAGRISRWCERTTRRSSAACN
jgi:hypothetical protein